MVILKELFMFQKGICTSVIIVTFHVTSSESLISEHGIFLGFFCAVGSIIVGDVCQECPIGTYADVANGTSCTDCPVGQTTPNNGTSDPADCVMLNKDISDLL